MRPVYFNGKFYSGSLNGVHRVADRLIRGVDAHLAEMPSEARPSITLLAPKQSQWSLDFQSIDVVEDRNADSQFWEQFILPFKAANGLLVNLCNLAPIFHFRKMVLLHDAQFALPDCNYPFVRRTGYRLLIPLMMRTSKQVLTVSNYSRQVLNLTGIAPQKDIVVLHNGADHILDCDAKKDIVSRSGLQGTTYCLLFGSTFNHKNNQVVFRAFEDAALDRIKLVVVGPPRAELEAAGLTPPKSAVFVGKVSDGELRALYESALCYLLPSTTEGFGLPPLEAMYCDCPTIVSPMGAIPEVCRDAALYAKVDDPGEWVQEILRLAEDPALRNQKCAAGRQRAQQFTWSATSLNLLKVIQKWSADAD